MKTPTLETERLILRPISMDDAETLTSLFNDWDLVKYTQAPWPLPKNNAIQNMNETLEKVSSGQQISWVITLKNNSEVIGRIDYRFFNNPIDRGFWLAKKYHAQGFMSEAVAATQDHIFLEKDIERIVVENVKENIGSRRVKEKNGAVLIEEKPESCSPHIQGPTQVWEITRENWAKIRRKT